MSTTEETETSLRKAAKTAKPRVKKEPPYRSIRALYTEKTITVYQAYNPTIASASLAAQTLAPPFKRNRMTWIKPSFLWMAHRSGWATKQGQERILAIEITREGFEWALRHSVLSHAPSSPSSFPPSVRGAQAGTGSTEVKDQVEDDDGEVAEWKKKLREMPVRVQWDPERDVGLRALGYRSLQVGLSGEAVDRYVDEWIVSVRDVTGEMKRVKELVDEGGIEGRIEGRIEVGEEVRRVLPVEREYPLTGELRGVIFAS